MNSPRAGTQQGSASSDGCVGSPFYFCRYAWTVLARHGVLWLVVVGERLHSGNCIFVGTDD
ncbi:hypothetical protein HMPREF1861_01832 [Corynebacterium kroppenstedtii]|nr:hypothetical protein HMPREF1861_01832 [Corynebacterium kroppenstedtii]